MSDLSRIILVLLLVLGNAVFVAAEYALVTARRSRLEEQAERHATARVALRADGRAGPLHQHGPGGDHGLQHPPRCRRRAADLGLLRRVAVARDRLHARLPDPHLPQRRARGARPEGHRPPARRADRDRAGRAASTCSRASSTRWSGSCRSRRTRSPACSASSRPRPASSSSRARTSAGRSPRPRTSGRSSRPRRR